MKPLFIGAIFCLAFQNCQKKIGTAYAHSPTDRLLLYFYLDYDVRDNTVQGLPIRWEKKHIMFYIHSKDSTKITFGNYKMICSPLQKDSFDFKVMNADTIIRGQFKVPKVTSTSSQELFNILTYQIDTIKLFPHYVPIRSGTWRIKTPMLDTIIAYHPHIMIVPDAEKDFHGQFDVIRQ